MADKYPLSGTLTGRERDLLAQKKLGDARLGYATDTSKLMFYEGTKWIGAEAAYVTQWSSSSSTSSQSSSSSSMSSSSSRSSSSSSSSMSSSSQSSSSSEMRTIYPVKPMFEQQVNLEADNNEIDIYTVINIEININQLFNMEVGVFDIEMVGLSVYTGSLEDLTTQGNYIPLVGSYAFSIAATGVEPTWLMSLATNFVTSLETSETTIIPITDKNYQRIIFDPIPQVHVLDGTVTMTAEATSGLPVTYVSSDTSIATVSGDTVTILDDGEVTITASQAGNNDFEEAIEVSQNLLIKPRIIVEIDSSNSATNSGIFVSSVIGALSDYTISWWQNIEFNQGSSDQYFFTSPTSHSWPIFDDGSAYMQVPGNRAGGMAKLQRGTDATDPIQTNPWSSSVVPGTFKENQWQHIAFTRNCVDALNKFYVDGVLVATYYDNISSLSVEDPNNPVTGGYNGYYWAQLPGSTKYEIREDGGTYQAAEDSYLLNDKPIYMRYHGGTHAVAPYFYIPSAAIYWSSVHNKWVLTNSVFQYQNDWVQANNGTYPGTQKITFSTSSTYNTTGWIATDNLSHGFYQNASGIFASVDTGVNSLDSNGYINRNQYSTYGPTDAEYRSGDLSILNDQNLGGLNSVHGFYFGRPYSTQPLYTDRKFTEIGIWEHAFLDDADIQTLYNLGHSNLKEPSSVVLGLKGGPTGYFRGGMDDFLASNSIRNVGNGPLADGEIMADLAELLADTNLSIYKP
jgi:hypothetical protein